jgi:hypothetical protein
VHPAAAADTGLRGAPTSEPIADEYACVRCDHVELRASGNDDFADPGRCDFCNP